MPENVILFADNNPDFLNVRKEFLIRAGYRVLEAYTLDDARRLLESVQPDLAILDMRLVDDTDEDDFSGIELARSSSPSIPKIILTGYPTWQAVRDALALQLNGMPPVIEFISKKEGPQALLRSVNWALRHPELRLNIVGAFEVPTLMAIPERISSLGMEESGRRLHESFLATAGHWDSTRKLESRHAARFHNLGLITSIMAILIVFFSVGLALFGQISIPLLPIIVAALTQSISAFFFVREDLAYKRVETCTQKLDEINKLENLLMICDSLMNSRDREKCKQNLVKKFLDHWI